jgi:hypothetical protein
MLSCTYWDVAALQSLAYLGCVCVCAVGTFLLRLQVAAA